MESFEIVDSAQDSWDSAHFQWRQMAEHHNSPDRFRYSFNAFIQESRNVTFRIQSMKAHISDFDQWYTPWQKCFRDSDLLRWANETRVQVTKRGGFRSNSVAFVDVIYSYLDIESFSFEADPFEPSAEICQAASSKIPEQYRQYCTIEIRRRWTADDLPSMDVLTASMHILQHLRALINSLAEHTSLGRHRLPFEFLAAVDMDGDLKGLAEPDVVRARADGTSDSWSEVAIPASNASSSGLQDALEQMAAASGKEAPPPVFDMSPQTTLATMVAQQMEYGEFFIEADGTFMSVLLTRIPSIGWRPQVVEFPDKASKFDFFHDLGKRVALEGIDAAVFGGEYWLSCDPDVFRSAYPDVEGSRDRMEAIGVSGIARSGEHVDMTRIFERDANGQPQLAPGRDDAEWIHPSASFWRPLWTAWGLPLEDLSSSDS